jgi:ABC-type transport system substrate-binding protein
MPTMAADGQSRSSMWAERLMDVDLQGNLVPCLADSWKIDSAANTITFNLHKGIKFQDGTDFNAQAVQWTYQQVVDAKAMPDYQFVKSIDVIDDYTIRFTMNAPNSIMIDAIWRPWIFSPTATNTNGKDWAVNHPVSTSAYKVVDYQRDILIKMVKNENYWRPGRPYMDGIELRLVRDPATASMLMQSGQADMWLQSTTQESADLRDKGFDVLVGTSTFSILAPDSLNSTSPFAKQQVREAVEYSLDRPAINKALGYGFTTAMDQLAPPGTAGYNKDYPVRAYNPAKAKQLLTDAGYPNGFETTLTLQASGQNLATVVQNYLSDVGIKATLDVADSGRYYATQFTNGWKGLLVSVAAISPEYSVAFVHHFSKAPDVKFASLAKTPEFLASVDAVLNAPDIPSMREATKKMVTQGSLDAMVIPITTNPVLTVVQKYVNTTYTKVLYWTGWRICDDWLAKK